MVRLPFRRLRRAASSPRRSRKTFALTAQVDTLESRQLLSGEVIISEFMASNTRTLPDQDNEFSDWIELRNTTAAPVSLEGWHLTDDKLDPDKWTFPAVTLPADGYLVVFASGKDRAVAGQQLHTNFNLAAGGEYLALFPPDVAQGPATEFDPYPRQQTDMSFGVGAASRQTTTLLSARGGVKYTVPTDGSLGNGWTAPEFDDSAWAGGQTGLGYEVTTTQRQPLPEESEPNGTSATADDAAANFGPASPGPGQGAVYQLALKGTVTPANDGDYFNIGTLQAGDRLTVAQGGLDGTRGTLGDPYVELYRLNGGSPQRVVFSDDDGPGNDSLIHRYAVVANDTYYVRARSFPNSTFTGTYALGVYLEDLAGAAPLTGGALVEELEPNNLHTAANDASSSWRPVQYVSSTAASMESAGDVDFYRFQLTAGDVISVWADSTSTVDLRTAVLSSNGTTVVAQEDGSSGTREDGDAARDSRIYGFTATTTGAYYVRVQSVLGAPGSYRLQVDLSTNTPPPAAAWFSGLVSTNLQSAMRGVNSGAYARVPFVIGNDTELADVDGLTLAMKYDDGFVAYLNGVEVARRNAPAGDAAAAFDAAATAGRDNAAAAAFETIDISAFKDRLVVGANILAVHGLNASADDADFLVLPEVRAVGPLRVPPPGFFSTPTPGRANGPVSALGAVADTNFNFDRGFYDRPFDLEITTATEGAQIRYTLNGDVPTATSGVVYTGPIRVDKTTTIRAMAFKPGYVSTNVDTQTYIFLDDVIRQSPTGQPPPGWPTSWGANRRDYGMDPDVVNNVQYRDTIKDDLTTLPTFSLVMDLDDLFNASNGIYANPGQDGILWERPASLELINPDGTRGFQADAGVRIRGGFSRSTGNPKHAFRFFFRSEYGQNELDFPLFGPDAAQSFKNFDLRTFQNYSWSFGGDARGIFMRDVLSRDLQLAMGQPAERGDYYHLYINGQYWGLYNTDERPEANYGASYFGGKPDDYDVIKVDPDLGYNIEATDGNMQAWTDLYNQVKAGPVNDALYQKLQGNNPDGTPNPALPALLDMDNLIDYCLVAIYGGNLDAPVSQFLGDQSPNNFFAVRNRQLDARQGFRFFIHDAEHTLLDVNQNRTGPFAAGSQDVGKSNPYYFFQRLWASPSFKLRVADRVQKHMVDPGGALTPAKVREAFLRRKEEIDRAVVGESARWGDAQVGTPLTRNAHWIVAVNQVLNNYIPQRTNNVLNQLKAANKGLYPAFGAPVFNQDGGTVPAGFQLTMSPGATTPTGAVIYYTLDGSDPRRADGTLDPDAIAYAGPINVNSPVTVRARTLNGAVTPAVWSAIQEATFAIDTVPLRVTELMYNPAPPPEGSTFLRQDFEFIELQNVGPAALDLSGVRFSNGVGLVFPDGTTLAPGQYVIAARNPDAFASRYPDVTARVFQFTGGLSDSGERIVISGPGPGLGGEGGPTLLDFRYSDAWEPATDGDGRSLVVRNPAAVPEQWNNPDAWRRSAAAGGSPGAADPAIPTSVAGRWLFYNRSGYDGTTVTFPDSSDDNALADDKAALLPGAGRATFANVSSYTKGINGLFIDLADLPPGTNITAADLEFRIGREGNPADWAAVSPTVVGLRRGDGVGGSDRLSVVFGDSAVKNTWLRVTVKANERTGLAAPDVFYFGSLAGETGDAPAGATTLRVSALDLANVRRGPQIVTAFTAAITNKLDIDREGKVNSIDLSAVRANLGASLTMIDPSAPPVAATVAPFSTTPVTERNVGDPDDVLGRQPASLFA